MKSVKISDIVTDAGTQVRNAICEDAVAEYAERMTEGDKFPPITVFHDGNVYYLADGFHRFMAATRVGFEEIDADVKRGTLGDATWYALGANKKNGQRLNRGDVRNAVEIALRMWPEETQQAIADQVGCSQRYVGMLKDDLIRSSSIDLPATITNTRGQTRPTSYAKQEPEAVEGAKQDGETDNKGEEGALIGKKDKDIGAVITDPLSGKVDAPPIDAKEDRESEPSNLSGLKRYWGYANKKERKAFLKWIEEGNK